jgi:hypothetical protein
MSNRNVMWAAGAALALWGAFAFAQEAPPKPELLVVFQEHVKPAKGEEYMATVKDMVALLKEEKADSPAFDLWAFGAPDFTYSYVTPMSSMGDMDTMHEAWMALYKGPDKAKWEALDARINDAILGSSRTIVARVASASYHPKKARLSEEEAKYRWFDVFTVVPGKEKDFVGLCKGLADLAAKAGYGDSWNTYSVVVGDKIPCFLVVSPAKDQADYAESDRAFTKAVGDEGKKIFSQIMAVTQHYDGHGEWYRPELSYQTPTRLKTLEIEEGPETADEKADAKAEPKDEVKAPEPAPAPAPTPAKPPAKGTKK